MLNPLFKENFAFSANYFEQLFSENKKFPQSIVFEGLDIFAQYFFSLELARILNCENKGEKKCNCINCTWIRENKHPAVITVSPVDFKGQDDNTKTVISVKQARAVIKNLAESSDFHRVFIFLNAKEKEPDKNSKNSIEKYAALNFCLPKENWLPSHIERQIFDDEAPNALLKSIEEPPLNTTFIFLAKNREDLINTIVSRSLVFRLPSKKTEAQFGTISEILNKYPEITLFDSYEILNQMQNYIEENNLAPNDALNEIEHYFGNLLKNNPSSKKIKNDIAKIQEAKKQLDSSLSPKTVFEFLFIEFAKC